jgi:hypothetical protein
MRRGLSESLILVSPEALFIFGGEDMSQICPQPGINDVEQWDHCFPYSMDTAGVEHMQHSGQISTVENVLVARDEIATGIEKRIVDARGIEAARQQVADFFNERGGTQSVDPTE